VGVPKGMAHIVSSEGDPVATLLYRLGRFAFRRRGLVTVVWVVLLGLVGVGAATLSGPTSNAFSIPGTESSRPWT